MRASALRDTYRVKTTLREAIDRIKNGSGFKATKVLYDQLRIIIIGYPPEPGRFGLLKIEGPMFHDPTGFKIGHIEINALPEPTSFPYNVLIRVSFNKQFEEAVRKELRYPPLFVLKCGQEQRGNTIFYATWSKEIEFRSSMNHLISFLEYYQEH